MQESVLSEEPKAASIEQLPIYVLRDKLTEKGIAWKPADKKAVLIKALLTGEAAKKKVEKKVAPRITDAVRLPALPIINDTLKAELDKIAGLRYELDETDGCINFYGRYTTCANIDQSLNNILMAAREAMKVGGVPPETSSLRDM